MIAIVAVAESQIGNAVKNPRLILNHAAANVAVELDADVAVGGEARIDRALDEDDVCRRLETFHAERRLELARADVEDRAETHIGVRVEYRHASFAEVRHQAQVHDATYSCFPHRAYASQQERRGRRRSLIVKEVAAVALEVAAEAHAEVCRRPSRR